MGVPISIYDLDGEKIWSAEMDVWGSQRKQYGRAEICPFRWPGQYADLDTGLYYNRFRYYDPKQGRYISQDRIGISGGLTPYSYVHNPISWSDPFGLHEAIALLNGEPVTKPGGGYSWYSTPGSSKAPFNGFGAAGHSEAKILEHLEKTQSGNLKNSKLQIISMGQITKGGKKTLSPLPTCGPCDERLAAFAKKHEMDIEYVWDPSAGDQDKKVYKGCT